MYLLNGESRHTIEISDRGFQYGDGLFETIEVLNGSPLFLKQHLQRLTQGCDKLLIPIPDIELLKKEAFQLATGSAKAVLKLVITRGSGGRGYRQPDIIQTTRCFSLHPFPDYPADFSDQGIVARFCHITLGLNPALAGIKHLNRLEQVIARSEWNSTDIQEGLMLDINDHVIEGTMSNIFLIKGNVLFTPIIDQCGVNGILRNIVISIAKKHKIKIVEKKITKENIYTADELFLSNSIIGIWPIKQIETQCYHIGPLTRKIQSLLFAYKQEEINGC